VRHDLFLLFQQIYENYNTIQNVITLFSVTFNNQKYEYLLYSVIAVLLSVLEVGYFRLAARFNIIDKPN